MRGEGFAKNVNTAGTAACGEAVRRDHEMSYFSSLASRRVHAAHRQTRFPLILEDFSRAAYEPCRSAFVTFWHWTKTLRPREILVELLRCPRTWPIFRFRRAVKCAERSPLRFEALKDSRRKVCAVDIQHLKHVYVFLSPTEYRLFSLRANSLLQTKPSVSNDL